MQSFSDFGSARANSNFDVRHRFSMAAVWEMPFGKGRHFMNRGGMLDALLGGWQLSGMTMRQTSHYLSITVPNARTLLGATSIGDWWPDRVADPRLDNRTIDKWFNTSAFVLPRAADGSYRFGNAGRSIVQGDSPFNFDAGLMKSFRLTERFRAQFRWETFNVTNTTTFADPNASLGNPDFGKSRASISNPRQLQFALRLSF